MLDDQTKPSPPLTTYLPYVLLAVVGIVLTALLAGRTFPAAVIKLTVDRADAQQQGLDFLRQQGAEVGGRWQTTSFAVQATVQDYLLASGGLPELEALAKHDLNLAHWRVRLFTPLDPEEWSVTLSTRTGRVIGFRHTIPEERAGATLPYTAAQQLAMQALIARPGAQLEPDDLRLISYQTTQQPERTDHNFIWERPALQRGEATYRYAVTLYGDEVGALAEYYQVPESWNRLARWHLRRGALLNSIGWMLTFAMMAGMGLVWLWAARNKLLRYRFVTVLLLPVLVIGPGMAANDILVGLKDYPTNISLSAYIFDKLEQQLGLLVNVGTAAIIAGMAGEALLWAGAGHQRRGELSLSQIFTRAGITSSPIERSLALGILIGIAQLGYLSLFYWIGMRWFGVWQPTSPTYDDLLSAPFPWLYAVALGLLPAIGEELVFRLGGIMLLRRLTRMPYLSVVLTALIWAALHTTYAQRPFFIRLIELTIVGIAFGFLFLRYGILASMAAHYTYNASLLLPLLISGSWLTILGGLLAFLGAGLLLIPAFARRIRRQPLSAASALARPLPSEPPPAAKPPTPYVSLYWSDKRRRQRLVLALAGIAAALIIGLLLRQPPALRRQLTSYQALARAQALVRELGLPTAGLFAAATPVDYLINLDADYLRDHPAERSAAQVIADEGQRAFWRIRYSAWDRDDSLTLHLGAAGELLTFNHQQAEDAPGATISHAEAHAMAEAFLARRGIDIGTWRLVESSAITRTRRVDHHFSWESPRILGEGAQPRVIVVVEGDQVAGLRPNLYVPPAYSRERERRTLQDIIAADWLPALPELTALLLGAACLWLSLRRPPPLRTIIAVGALGFATTTLEGLLRLSPAQLAQLPELIRGINDALFAAVLAGAELGLIAGGAALLWSVAFPRLAPLERQIEVLFNARRARRAALWRDGRTLGLMLLPALLALVLLHSHLADPGQVRSPGAIDSHMPALSSILSAARSALRTALLLAGATALLARFSLGRAALPVTLFGAILVWSAPQLEWQFTALAWPVACLLALQLRGNLIALIVLLWSSSALLDGSLLLTMYHTWYQVHGIIILLLVVQLYRPGLRDWYVGRKPAGASSPNLAIKE